MKSNMNATLERWTRCIPTRAKYMTHAAVVESEDVVCTKDRWADADSLSGLTARDDGSLVITGSIVDKIGWTTQDGYLTDLDNSSPFSVAQIEWKGSDPEDFPITKVQAWLHPKRTGDPQTVARWGCQIMALYEVGTALHGQENILTVYAISNTIWVDEGGSVAHEVTFDFTGPVYMPRPKRYRVKDPSGTYPAPTTFIMIRAVKTDGSPADNCGWGKDSAKASEVDSSNVLRGFTLTDAVGTDPDLEGLYFATDTTEVPYVTIQTGTFSQQTVEFTTTPFDLGATPASADEVVFKVEGSELSGTTLTASASVGAGYQTFKDGQTAADIGLAASRYYDIKCVLDPDSTSIVSPILRCLGVEDVAITDLSKIADVKDVHHQVDPITLKSYITNAHIVAIQHGVRDFNDAITTLFSTYYIGEIQFRLYWGHEDLDRQYWMLMGVFIEPTYETVEGAMEIDAISPLALVRATLPKFDTGTYTRDPLTYAGTTLKDTYDDLLDGQIELAGRFRGPGIEDDTTTVSRYINEKVEAKEMLDVIAYCDGSAVGEDQGRVRTFDLYGDKAVVAVFPSKAINPVYVSPGYEHRIPEWTVNHDWSDDESRYLEERYYSHGSSLVNLGKAAMNDVREIDDAIARWLQGTTLPNRIGQRAVDLFGVGLLTLGFNSIYAYPELQLGDLAAVQTDRFTAVDPNTRNAVRGNLWVLGVVVDHDKAGENFSVWVRDYADIFSAATAGAITVGFRRARAKAYHSTDQTFSGTPFTWDVPWNSEEYDHGNLHSIVSNTHLMTVPAKSEGHYVTIANITYSGLGGGGGAWWAMFVLIGSGGTYRTHTLDGNSPATGDFTITLPQELDAADTVFLRVLVNSGVSITMNCGTADESSLAISRIGV